MKELATWWARLNEQQRSYFVGVLLGLPVGLVVLGVMLWRGLLK